MNVLIIGVDSSKYGSPMSMSVLARELKAMGHGVICIVPKKGAIESVLNEYGIEYKIIKIKKWIYAPQSKLRTYLMKLYRCIMNFISEIEILVLCKRCKIDIVHINSSATSCGYWTSRLLKLKLVWHIREFVEEDFGLQFYNKRKVFRRFQKADSTLAISKAIYSKYENYIPKRKMWLVYNGIDEKKYLCTDMIFRKEPIVIAHVARLEKSKGQEEFIDACIKYQKKNGTIDFEIWIIGDGAKSYFEELKKRATELGKHCIFKGFCDDLSTVFPFIDIVVVNSRCEAFGRVTVESMMSGRLVIGANTGGTKELIGDSCGLLYEYGNSDELMVKIEYALNNKSEMREIAKKGQAHAMWKYTASENAKRINDIYMNIMKE